MSAEAEKASEVLELGDGRDESPDQQDTDAEAAADESSTKDSASSEPSGLNRLFRTDKPLDLDDSTDWWDPRGKGGINRIGAALQQMGGWEYVMPVVWLFIGTAEAIYLFLVDRGVVPSRNDDDEQDETDDQPGHGQHGQPGQQGGGQP